MSENENPPKVTVETDSVTIEVTDQLSAEAAMPYIQGALEYHIQRGVNAHNSRTRQKHEAVDAECDKCGYKWEYTGKNPKGSTCPDCGKYTKFEPDLVERDLR